MSPSRFRKTPKSPMIIAGVELRSLHWLLGSANLEQYFLVDDHGICMEMIRNALSGASPDFPAFDRLQATSAADLLANRASCRKMFRQLQCTSLGEGSLHDCRARQFGHSSRPKAFECDLKRRSCKQRAEEPSFHEHTVEFATLKRSLGASSAFWLLSQLPANSVESTTDFSKGSFSTESYIVTLGLFLISLPGMWIGSLRHVELLQVLNGSTARGNR